jgi:hypothetical protein
MHASRRRNHCAIANKPQAMQRIGKKPPHRFDQRPQTHYKYAL